MTAADPKTKIDALIAARQAALEQAAADLAERNRAQADAARQERRQILIDVLGDFWPIFEPYTARIEIQHNGDYYTAIDARPLELALFYAETLIYRGGTPGIRYTTSLGTAGGKVSAGDAMDEMIAYLRAEYHADRKREADRQALAAQREREAAATRQRQAELKAEYAATYRQYEIERRRINRHNAELVAAWNQAHAEPYEIKQIAYSLGLADIDEENAGRNTETIATFPNGDWHDPAGYMLRVNYDGTTTRRRYSRIVWEDAPQTITPGPAAPHYAQRNGKAGRLTIYARPAAEPIETTAADLLAALLPAPARPAEPGELWSNLAREAEEEICQELDAAADVAPDAAGDYDF